MSLTNAVGALLPALDAAFPTALVTVLNEFLEKHSDALAVDVYLADYDMQTLRRLHESTRHRSVSLPIDNSESGQAYRGQTATVSTSGDLTTLHLPITVRAERLGVLSITLPAVPATDVIDGLSAVAVSLGYVLMTAANYTDLIERARREQPLTLPAEIQWAQLPTRAYSSDTFSIAGQLVPAYSVGGDLFDYAVERDELIVTVTDAMGHGLNASLLGTLANGALRNARRTGLSLADQVRSADKVLYGQFGGDQFVTAVALSLDLHTGLVTAINAGNPPVFLLREHQVSRVTLTPQLPMGMFEATDYQEQSFQLLAGDRLIFVSDGVLEARAADGELYGEVRTEGAVLATATVTPEEVVRQLVGLLRSYQGDEPRDDATIVCLDWKPAGLLRQR